MRRSHDAAVNVRHAGGDEAPRPKPAVALGGLDGADLARPCIDVLKKVAVDRRQAVEVEIARRHGLKETKGDKLAFRCRVPDVQPDAENGVVRRIAVVAVAHPAAASLWSSFIARPTSSAASAVSAAKPLTPPGRRRGAPRSGGVPVLRSGPSSGSAARRGSGGSTSGSTEVVQGLSLSPPNASLLYRAFSCILFHRRPNKAP